jgi:hypothetical protein
MRRIETLPELPDSVLQGLENVGLLRVRKQMENDFTVAGGLETGALFFKIAAQGDGVNQVSIVAEGYRSPWPIVTMRG